MSHNLLLAHRTHFFLHQPLTNALAVEYMFAGQLIYLLPLLHVVVADGAELLLMLFGSCYLLNFLVLVFGYSLGHLPYLFLELEQLLIGHVIGVNIDSSLILHAHHHVLQILQIHQSVLLAPNLYPTYLCCSIASR